MCVGPNEGLIATLCACCETCQKILASESWKSVSAQKVSQTNRMVWGVLGGKKRAKLDWHLNPGSLRVTRMCRRTMLWLATDCMLGSQPNHGWQLCIPL